MADKTLILSLVVFAGILCQWLAWRVKLPAILFLLGSGLVAGPVLGLLDADELFGDLLFPFISLAVSIILFEGSLTLKFEEISGLKKVIRRLVSVGALLTWLITAVTTHFALGFSWQLSLLFGAITSVTGPTVIVPLLRTVRPKAAVANILRWEGIVIDPIGATLAVLVYEFILLSGNDSHAMGYTLFSFAKTLVIGLVIGSGAAFGYGQVIRRHWLPEFLHNVATLALVICCFTVSNLLQHESGLLTVTVLGMVLANQKDVPMQEILDFKESLSVLLISVLFIILASRLDLAAFTSLGWPAVFVLLSIQFLARPLSVAIATHGSPLSWPERHLLAWIAPRGIVAAAISALFAIRLDQAGFTQAPQLVPLTFMVIIGTVVLQSATAGAIAEWLGVAEPEPKGFLLIGANRLARTIGLTLQEHGFRVVLADANWESIKKARMAGLETFYGQPVSEYASRHLDLIGIGRMLGLSPSSSLNALACMYYRQELGRQAVFSLQTGSEKKIADEKMESSAGKCPTLFGADIEFTCLTNALNSGWTIHTTSLTETFSFADSLTNNGGMAIALFAIRPTGKLEVFTTTNQPQPKAGWTVISLLPPAHQNGQNILPVSSPCQDQSPG